MMGRSEASITSRRQRMRKSFATTTDTSTSTSSTSNITASSRRMRRRIAGGGGAGFVCTSGRHPRHYMLRFFVDAVNDRMTGIRGLTSLSLWYPFIMLLVSLLVVSHDSMITTVASWTPPSISSSASSSSILSATATTTRGGHRPSHATTMLSASSPLTSSNGTPQSPSTTDTTIKPTTSSNDQKEEENNKSNTSSSSSSNCNLNEIFDDFVTFLEQKQIEIIQTIEDMDGSGCEFTNDVWGLYEDEKKHKNNDGDNDETTTKTATLSSGGRTRVIQGGDIVEKGACSLTLIKRGVLSAQRAEAIRSRQSYNNNNNNDTENDNVKDGSGSSNTVQEGDTYAAAALSIVLHSRSPFIPTFRSDVRIFMVESSSSTSSSTNDKTTIAFFGGGADLTPYYLGDSTTGQDMVDDIVQFHTMYRDLATKQYPVPGFDYPTIKHLCDKYFYLPARSEHRGTGGIFFDDMDADMPNAVDFVKGVTDTWMPSWLPIIERRRNVPYTDQQKQWQLLRRGRYLEFNLLYDRGVAFGLKVPNPRVEGVMVSAPPLIAWEYNHQILEGSEEARIMDVLKNPVDWVEE